MQTILNDTLPGIIVFLISGILICIIWAFRVAIKVYLKSLIKELYLDTGGGKSPYGNKQKITPKENKTISQVEIESFWGYRPHAHTEMSKYLFCAKDKIFIAGGALSTLLNMFNDPDFRISVAKRINSNSEFRFTLVMDFENQFSTSELGRQSRAAKIKANKKIINDFLDDLDRRVAQKISRPLVQLKKYNDKVSPRHFLLASDDTIFIGSYLSHKAGQYSYLLKIRDKEDAVLFPLLNAEIDYVESNTTSVAFTYGKK